MADFNRHLKKNKVLVFFTIFLFLCTCWFSSCGRSSKEESSLQARNEKRIAEKKSSRENADLIDSTRSGNQVRSSQLHAGEQNAPPTLEELGQMADKTDRYFQILEEGLKEIPRDTFDPQAIIDKVGKDPGAIYKWVRDNTYIVPYQGVLRGAIGVLMDSLGNSLDRALLLYELLRLAGCEVRLARGRLSDKQAEEILEGSWLMKRSEKSPPAESLAKGLDKLINEYSRKFKIDPVEFRNFINQSTQDGERFSKSMAKRVTEQTAFLSNAIKKYRDKENDRSINAEKNSLKDHWWVQIVKGDSWIDLDPSLADTEQGKNLINAESTYQPNELSNELFHCIKLKVIIEKWINGNLEERTVLHCALKPSELIGERVILTQVPMNWPKDFSFIGDKDPIRSLNAKILNEKEWLPVLIVGSDKIIQSSFTDSGEVNDKPGKKRSSGSPGGIAGGIFGALGGKESTKEEGESYLTAEWVEYEVQSPGNEVSKIRRQVFDLIGPAIRAGKNIKSFGITDFQKMDRGLALIGETEILLQVCHLSPYFVLQSVIQGLLANRQILLESFHRGKPLTNNDIAEISQRIKPLPGTQYTLAAVRNQWSRTQDKYYLEHPNILNYIRGLHQNAQGEIKGYMCIDIVFNDVAVLDKSTDDPFQIRLEQGVLDTNAEALILAQVNELTENTSELFAKTRKQSLEWLTIKDLSDPALRQLNISNDARFRVEQDLAQGNIVILPEKEVEVNGRPILAWWRINATNGQTLGISLNGGGQSFAEWILGEIAIVIPGITCLFSSREVKEPCRWYSAINCWAGLGEGGVAGSIIYFLSPSRFAFAFVIALAAISFAIAEKQRQYSHCR